MDREKYRLENVLAPGRAVRLASNSSKSFRIASGVAPTQSVQMNIYRAKNAKADAEKL